MAPLFCAHLMAPPLFPEGVHVRMAPDKKDPLGFLEPSHCCLCPGGLSEAREERDKRLLWVIPCTVEVDPFCPMRQGCIQFEKIDCDFEGWWTSCGQRDANLSMVYPYCHLSPKPKPIVLDTLTAARVAVMHKRKSFTGIVKYLAETRDQKADPETVEQVYLAGEEDADEGAREVVFDAAKFPEGGKETGTPDEIKRKEDAIFQGIVESIESKCMHPATYERGKKDPENDRAHRQRIEVWHSLCGSCRLTSHRGGRIRATSPIPVEDAKVAGSRFAKVCARRIEELDALSKKYYLGFYED